MDEFITFNIFNFMPSKMQKKINEHDFILCQTFGWASECIHYLNLLYEKVWSIGKVALNCFPQGLLLFLDCVGLFLKSHVCINMEAL